MKFTKSPENFFVDEICDVDFSGAKYFYYTLEKRGIDTPNAIRLIEKQNKCRVFFSGLKDSNAATTQQICAATELATPEDARISLNFEGKSDEKMFTGCHIANKFTAKFEEVSGAEMKFLPHARDIFFPNYFDEQRLGKKSVELGQKLFELDFEGASKAALTSYEEFESEKSKQIKQTILKNWGKWEDLAKMPEIPEAKRKIFESLAQNNNFEKAIWLLEPKTVSIACRAMQAKLFNEKLRDQILKQKPAGQKFLEISGELFPAFFSKNAIKRELEIAPIFPRSTVLKRKTFFTIERVKKKIAGDSCLLEFVLVKGCYGTIAIKRMLLGEK